MCEHSATGCGVVAAGCPQSPQSAGALKHSTQPDTHPTSPNSKGGVGPSRGCLTPVERQCQPGDVPTAEVTAQSPPKPRQPGCRAAPFGKHLDQCM